MFNLNIFEKHLKTKSNIDTLKNDYIKECNRRKSKRYIYNL